jgi:hypothetical protein
MRITVVGVLIIIGTIVALALIADKLIAANITKQRGPDNDQPNPNS